MSLWWCWVLCWDSPEFRPLQVKTIFHRILQLRHRIWADRVGNLFLVTIILFDWWGTISFPFFLQVKVYILSCHSVSVVSVYFIPYGRSMTFSLIGPAIHPYMNTTNSSIGLSNSTLLLSPTSYPTSLASNPLQEKRAILKEHIVVVVIGLMLMSYVVAAGVEETMKHFIVRCCRFPSRLKSPHTGAIAKSFGPLILSILDGW